MKNLFGIILVFALLTGGCKKEVKETCSDGKQNQSENGVDCGGPCTACASCSDGIKNQDETAVDCGGSCSACIIDHFTYSDNLGHKVTTDSSLYTKSNKNLVALIGQSFDDGYLPIELFFKSSTTVTVGTFESAALDLSQSKYYYGTAHPYTISAATVNISSMNSTKMSGSFSLAIQATSLSDPAQTSITGTFNNVPVQ